MSIKILQINVGRARRAHDVAYATAIKEDIDIIFIQEPNKKIVKNMGLISDTRQDVAVLVLNKKVGITDHKCKTGYIRLSVNGTDILNCYISPNIPRIEYCQKIDEIMEDARSSINSNLIILGDFNAKSPLWSPNTTDERGTYLENWMATLDLTALNNGQTPTFIRNTSESYIDITIVSERAYRQTKNWRVSLEESLSLHRYIMFEIQDAGKRGRNQNIFAQKTQYDPVIIKNSIEILRHNIGESHKKLIGVIKRAQSLSICRRNAAQQKPTTYWWNETVGDRRKECNKARRKVTRARANRLTTAERTEELERLYKNTKTEYRNEINNSKREKWKKILEKLDEDVWGQGFQIVTKHLRRPTTAYDIPTQKKRELVDELFPDWDDEMEEWEATDNFRQCSMEDLMKACKKIKTGKSAGPDGIQPETIKVAVETMPEQFINVINRILRTQVFPKTWKKARVALIPKGQTNQDKYRPICILDVLGKLLEHVILAKLEDHITISNSQFGFRKGKSTIEAIEAIIGNTNHYWQALVCIDIKNAFNTAKWSLVTRRLQEGGTPEWLVNLIRSYFQDREIIVEEYNKSVTQGVPQGSILGPTLWNILYDEVLKIELPPDCETVAYADDLTLIVRSGSKEVLMEKADHALHRIYNWMNMNHLEIAPQKTEAVIFKGPRNRNGISFTLGGNQITPTKYTRCLGIYIDDKLIFNEHVKRTIEKAEKSYAALVKLMPNIGGPAYNKRLLLSGVVQSILLYGAPIWHRVANTKKYGGMMESTQRKMLLKITSAYRTVSYNAATVIAGVTPIKIQILERVRLHKRKNEGTEITEGIRREEKDTSWTKWQTEWENNLTDAQWTKTLIPHLRVWLKCEHRNANYFLTQFLSGHGSFRRYTHRIGKTNDARCIYCRQIQEDSPEHTVFKCTRWREWRKEIIDKEGTLTPENIIEKMTSSKESWESIQDFITRIMKTKEGEERDYKELGGG